MRSTLAPSASGSPATWTAEEEVGNSECSAGGRANTKELAVIRIPTEEEEQLRHIHRQRIALVRARTKLQAQGRSLMINHGQPALARWWRQAGWKALSGVLPAWLRTRLEIYRPLLELLDEQIATLTAQIEATAPKELPSGLGKLTSVVVTREVCDWRRFKNRRQVSSYTGLCPGEYSSGSKRVPGSVTKHGNPRLRAALVVLAWRLVRFQPGYPPIAKRLETLRRGAKATSSARKKAIVCSPTRRALAIPLRHLGRRPPARRRPLAPPHRPMHRTETWLPALKFHALTKLLNHFIALERDARSQPNRNLSHGRSSP
jgi:transposase